MVVSDTVSSWIGLSLWSFVPKKTVTIERRSIHAQMADL